MTPDERDAIRKAERKHDMTYDTVGRNRTTAARSAFAEHRQKLAASRNPEIAARLEAGRERLAEEQAALKGMSIAQTRTNTLMILQMPYIRSRLIISGRSDELPF